MTGRTSSCDLDWAVGDFIAGGGTGGGGKSTKLKKNNNYYNDIIH